MRTTAEDEEDSGQDDRRLDGHAWYDGAVGSDRVRQDGRYFTVNNKRDRPAPQKQDEGRHHGLDIEE